MIRGLREYIKKHGRHLTDKLAEDVLKRYNFFFWNKKKVMRALDKRV